jgi:hypothetical protein
MKMANSNEVTSQAKRDLLRKIYAGLLLCQNPYADQRGTDPTLDPESTLGRFHKAAHEGQTDEVVKILSQIDYRFTQLYSQDEIDELVKALSQIVRNDANMAAAPYVAPSDTDSY